MLSSSSSCLALGAHLRAPRRVWVLEEVPDGELQSFPARDPEEGVLVDLFEQIVELRVAAACAGQHPRLGCHRLQLSLVSLRTAALHCNLRVAKAAAYRLLIDRIYYMQIL